MFPLVQSLPEDRMILIDTREPAGACTLVVWANQVLGLTVLVKKYGPKHTELVERQFGVGNNNVILDLRDLSTPDDFSTLDIKQPSITLLSVADKDELIVLKSHSDEVDIDAAFKQSAKGYGFQALKIVCAHEGGREALFHELTLLTVAFAVIIARHLFPIPRAALKSHTFKFPGASDKTLGSEPLHGAAADDDARNKYHSEQVSAGCAVPEHALVGSARFLFNDTSLKLESIKGHVLMSSRRPLTQSFEMPDSISLILDQQVSQHMKQLTWHEMLETVRNLSLIVLAFAFVRDLRNCEELPMSAFDSAILNLHVLMTRLKNWDGKGPIWIPEDTWFLVLAELVVGHKTAIDPTSTCLVSDRGWSVFLSTFGDADPSFTDAGHVAIRKGVPCRDGVRKHTILDGPSAPMGYAWKVEQTVGGEESLRCANTVYHDRPFCGDQRGCFLVTLRLNANNPPGPDSEHRRYTGFSNMSQREVESRRCGYRELFASLWGVRRSQSCEHESSAIKLPLSCASVSGFGDLQMSMSELKQTARIIVCLTAHNSSARWRALLAIHANRFVFSPPYEAVDNVLLRGKDCCLQCAVNQALVQPSHWFVIL